LTRQSFTYIKWTVTGVLGQRPNSRAPTCQLQPPAHSTPNKEMSSGEEQRKEMSLSTSTPWEEAE
jgi:hypothetical protein